MGSFFLRRFGIIVVLYCLFGLSLVGYLWIPNIINKEIRKQIWDQVVMRPGTAEDAYERFVNSTSEKYLTRFYMFNITNLDDVRENGSKPILEELGPYTYRTMSQKYDIQFHWNGSISYKERTIYLRQPELTVGNFDDDVVTLNLALVGVLDRVLDQTSFQLLEDLISRAAVRLSGHNHLGIFLKRTVEELLFGYDEPILEVASRFATVETRFKLVTNDTVETNDTCSFDQTSMINSGLEHLDRIGQLEMWNGRRSVDNWNGYSEPVHGTAGTFFKPGLSGKEELNIWVPEMYRSMPIRKSEETEVHGIPTFRYRISPQFWQKDDRYFQRYKGLVNVTNNSAGGSKGPSVFFSNPHFCGADQSLLDGVRGLSCHKEDHEFYIDMEPYTGVSLRAAARLMVSSAYSNKYDAIDPNLSSTILPIFWLEMSQEATEEQTDPLRSNLYRAVNIRDVLILVSLITMILFSVIIFAYFLKFIRNCIKHRRRQHQASMQSTNGALTP